jgi:general secretion pathway protein B
MSYILDALRRADAERERGGVPSLHTQQYGALPGDDEEPRSPRLLLTVIVVLVLALGSAVAWNLWGGRDTAPRVAVQSGVLTPPPVPPTTATSVAPAPAATMPNPSVAVPSPTPSSVTPPSVAQATPATTGDEPEARRRLLAAAASMKAERRGAARTAPSPPLRGPAASSATSSTPGKLPEALRRELPTLAFGGASFSKDPASRMVIFNGRVFHEGDVIAPDLVLQQIRNKAAIFSYKGFVYEVAF